MSNLDARKGKPSRRGRKSSGPHSSSAGLPRSAPVPAAKDSLTFEHAAALVLGRLQVALSELLKAAPGQTRTASEVERAFGIDYKLGWQIHRIATAENPLSAGSNVPARVSIEKLLRSASRRQVPKAIVAQVLEAFDDFEALTASEAEDREELSGMLAALVPEAREKRELDVKRAAFKAMSHVKGVTMEAQVGAFILNPSKDGLLVDRATFSAYVGLRRLRAAAHIGFATTSATTPTSSVLTLDGLPPDDLNSILLPDFCSVPVPRFAVTRYGSTTHYSLEGAHVGLRAAFDLVMAEHRPGAMRRYQLADGRKMNGVANMPDLPMKRQTTDIYVHRDLYPEGEPVFAVYDTVPRGMPTSMADPAREIDRIPFAESLALLPGGMSEPSLPHLPGYLSMLTHVCGKLGWNPDAFRCYRLDVLYPIYGAQYMIGFNLPEQPHG